MHNGFKFVIQYQTFYFFVQEHIYGICIHSSPFIIIITN